MSTLSGLSIIEFEGLGPCPLAGMILADMGAEVTLIRRPQRGALAQYLAAEDHVDILNRGKYPLTLDLKRAEDVALVLELLQRADALIEGYRPQVMERLGLAPERCWAQNQRLIYGRMTGWGQTGLMSPRAGHDLNYVALSGMMGLGREGVPPPRVPPTLAGDAIGAMGLALGVVAAIHEARQSGQGQVVDTAIVDMVAMLGSIAHGIVASGLLAGHHPSPFYDAPYYDIYECADGQWISLAAMEPEFYAVVLDKLQLTDVSPTEQNHTAQWPALKARLQALFKTAPQAHWNALFADCDACYAPVLNPRTAAQHPHNCSRNLFRQHGKTLEAMPAPIFSRTPSIPATAPQHGRPSRLLQGLGAARVAALQAQGIV